MDALIKALRSLIIDIEAMGAGNKRNWYGPFSEFEEEDNTRFMTAMTVEWPNLAISLERVKAELAKVAK